MNKIILNPKNAINGLKKPLIALGLTLFVLLAISLIFLPGKANAATTTTSTTSNIIIPIAGYYYYIDSYGNYKPCDMPNCGAYGPFANAQGFADFRSTYKPTPTYGTGYGTSYEYLVNTYKPYTGSYSTYPSNNYQPSAYNYNSAFETPIYTAPTYKPYVKSGSTITTGPAQTSPKYVFNANGLLGQSNGYNAGYNNYLNGTNYGYDNSYGGFRQTNSGSNNYGGGGFIMTSSSY